MSLVIDASVAIKWFIDEPLHEHARYLLKGEERLYAPDLLLAEVGNIAWKKVIRGEIEEEQAQKIALSLRDLPITLSPVSELIDRALQIALSIKHPVYDCLYLACAESLDSSLVTADDRLRRGLAGTPLALICQRLDDRYNISLSEEMIKDFIRQFEHIEKTWKSLDTNDIKLNLDTPVFRSIRHDIQALSDTQKIDLIALGWLGQGHFGSNWTQLQENVRKSLSLSSDNDLISLVRLSEHIRIGWQKFKVAGTEMKK
ncbi:type II toxin-antitoxin system VapC family toxin [Dongia deserti]|uniref:type II toxin-antitoxin system VapC family toxin n=1 Tax=Dongia deserti TaxID=2268030 RepID=UPI000E65A3D3|nr:type II toxin-antitoxin system VapC family toxin [Dongia deserti]